jgi:hypothetical protein
MLRKTELGHSCLNKYGVFELCWLTLNLILIKDG